MEAFVGHERCFLFRGTQMDVDGNRGKPLVEAFMDHHMVARVITMDKVIPNKLKAAVNVGAALLRNKRNKKDKERYLKKKETMDTAGCNIIDGLQIRKGYTDDKGKRRFSLVTIELGANVNSQKKRRSDSSTSRQLIVDKTIELLKR